MRGKDLLFQIETKVEGQNLGWGMVQYPSTESGVLPCKWNKGEHPTPDETLHEHEDNTNYCVQLYGIRGNDLVYGKI